MRTPFFDALIDDFSIWQHTDGEHVLKEEGYALDDAARGVIACLALGKRKQAVILLDYVIKSRRADGFYGFATADRQFIRYPSSDDAKGQAVWAMGAAYAHNLEREKVSKVLRGLKKQLPTMQHVRGIVYALLGAVYVDKTLAKDLYKKLVSYFEDFNEDWLWPESTMTYGNGILPYVFLRYGLIMNDQSASKFGYQLLEFVEEKSSKGRIRGPIGNDGWLVRNESNVPDYSQQPIDTAYMIWAWGAAYENFQRPSDMAMAKTWMKWFDGDNIAKAKMYDPKTLKCYDGIDKEGVHYHSGAESNICFLLSKQILADKHTL